VSEYTVVEELEEGREIIGGEMKVACAEHYARNKGRPFLVLTKNSPLVTINNKLPPPLLSPTSFYSFFFDEKTITMVVRRMKGKLLGLAP